MGSLHDSSSSLDALRASAQRGALEADQLAALREAAARRMAMRSGTWELASRDLLDELLARDEELAAATDELREQVDALSRAAAVLERERSKYVDLFALAPEAYVVTDLAGLTHEANVAAGALFGAEPRALVGRPLISFVARQDTRAFRRFLHELQAADAGGSSRSFSFRMRPRGQAVFVANGRAALVRTESNRPVAVRWLLRRFDREETLHGARLAEGELARVLVEDLRGPLTTISGWSHLLEDGQIEDLAERQLALGWIRKSADAQRAALEQLGELCDACDDLEHHERETVQLRELVANAVAEVGRGRDAADAPCPIEVQAGSSGPEFLVQCDAKRLTRAIALLLRRCVDGTPRESGAVRARLTSVAGQVVLEIEAPEGAAVPGGWAVRVATASRLVARDGGRVVVGDDSPTCRLRLPMLPATASDP